MRRGDVSGLPLYDSPEACVSTKPKVEIPHSFVQRVMSACRADWVSRYLHELAVASNPFKILLQAEWLFGLQPEFSKFLRNCWRKGPTPFLSVFLLLSFFVPPFQVTTLPLWFVYSPPGLILTIRGITNPSLDPAGQDMSAIADAIAA